MSDAVDEEVPQCSICISPLQDDQTNLWTCQQCTGSTHLSCMAQWIIRQAHPEILTCPMCRHEYNLRTMETAAVARGRRMARPAVARLLATLLSAATSERAAPSGAGTVRAPGPDGVAVVDQAHGVEQDEEEEYEEEAEDGGLGSRLALQVHSREVHIHVNNIIFRC